MWLSGLRYRFTGTLSSSAGFGALFNQQALGYKFVDDS
jgi:hypothetical protein